ncbi:MAG: hypothetical protein AAF497_25595, partial [Planctomycetota bacterium]
MRIKRNALMMFLVLCGTTLGQIVIDPDESLWTGDLNPSGLPAVPILQYDPSNGEMWINTVGLNGVSDTATRFLLEGDDVGTVSISVESPPAISTSPNFQGFVNGNVWNGQHFAGKQQVFCMTEAADFLTPTEGMRVWTFDAGLTPADFGSVEMAVNYGNSANLPGGILFGQVQFVPEPSTHLLLLTLDLMTLPFIRKAN